jgi:hypothetical protein
MLFARPQDMIGKILIAAASTVAIAFLGAALAARLPISTLTIEVLSVEEKLSKSETYANGQTIETTTFVARAKIQKIVQTDHGLSPGAVIDILYRRTRPSLPGRPNRFLEVGETVTLDVFGSGHSFTWR